MVSKVKGRGPIDPPPCLRVTFFTLCLLGLRAKYWEKMCFCQVKPSHILCQSNCTFQKAVVWRNHETNKLHSIGYVTRILRISVFLSRNNYKFYLFFCLYLKCYLWRAKNETISCWAKLILFMFFNHLQKSSCRTSAKFGQVADASVMWRLVLKPLNKVH